MRGDFAAKVCQVPAREDTPKKEAPKVENKAKQEINKIVKTESSGAGAKIKTKKLILKETFMCSCIDFYNVS